MIDEGMHDGNEGEARIHCQALFDRRDMIEKRAHLIQNPNQEGNIVQRYGNDDHYYIKAFLLSADRNLNLWGVTPESLEQRVGTFIGKPLVLYENEKGQLDHPVLKDMNPYHAEQYQDLFRVGTIIDITTKDADTYYAIIEVTEPKVKAAFMSGDLPLYVSPGIAKLGITEPEDRISNWIGMHLAVVADPAYTVKKALITGSCSGDQENCLLQLRTAHVQKYGEGNCGFCIKKAIVNSVSEFIDRKFGKEIHVRANAADDIEFIQAVVKTANKILYEEEPKQTRKPIKEEDDLKKSSSNEQEASSSHSMQNTQSRTEENYSMGEQNTQTAQPEANKSQGVDVQALQTQVIQLQAEVDKLKPQNATLVAERDEAIKKFEAANGRVKELEDNFRRREIEGIITAAIIEDEAKRKARIDTLVASNMTAEQIKELYSDHIALAQQQGRLNHAVTTPGYTAEAPYGYKTASTQPQNEQVDRIPAWMRAIQHTVRSSGGNE